MTMVERLADLVPERPRPLKRVEYERLVDEGFFQNERLELLDGLIVELVRPSPRRAVTITELTRRLILAEVPGVSTRVRSPFAASEDSLSQPDLAVVPEASYDDAHPERAFLLIEVSDEALRKDRRIKTPLYARAGVPEYWIVNLVERCIEVHRRPRDGTYGDFETVRPDGVLVVEALGVAIPASAILR